MVPHLIRPRPAGALLFWLLCPALLAASTALAAPHVFQHPTLGFEITYPDGYTVTSRDRGATVQTLADVQAMQGHYGSTPSRWLEIMIYDNPEQLAPQDWVRRHERRSNWSLTRNDPPNSITFAGRPAITYTWCGEYCGDALAFNRGDGRSLVFINTLYSNPNDPTRGDLKRIASSIRFVEDGAVRPQSPGGVGAGLPPVVVQPEQIIVLSATYGGSCRAPMGNWTGPVVRECNGKSRCDFLVNNRMGDPAPNCAKDFTVEWRCGNDPTVRRSARPPQGGENYFVTLACDAQPVPPPPPAPVMPAIAVTSATYGASCGAPPGNWTAILARECNGRPSCDVRVDDRFGDPARGCAKDFVAEWTCTNDPNPRRTGHPPRGGEGYLVRLGCGEVAAVPPPAPAPVPVVTEPPPGEAWLYSDCGFNGRMIRINADTPFFGPDMNHRISAVKLGPGTSVSLHEHQNFRGRGVVLDRSEACLADLRFNDVASSARIIPGPPPGEVWLYADCNYQGRSKRVNMDMPWLGWEMEDRLSSVRLGPGTSVVLYKHRDFRGAALALERNEPCLRDRGFNDRASSIQLLRR